ncbi:MAG: phosphoribosylpyrophosphate synthetase [Saprospiraceae bacterium]|nr:phosphoribosylpyrophosphate synthetase [Saprospiraceae bacterium]
MYTYDTLSQALSELQKRGFKEDFNLLEDCLECNGNAYAPAKFNVLEVYRFEGMTNPDDSSVLYAIETDDGLKGTLVDAYGAYANALSSELLAKLNIVGH